MSQEFAARLALLAERAEHGAGGHAGVVLLDAANHRAHVDALGHDADADGIDDFVDELGDLAGHALLHLKPLGKHIHDARDFGQADDFAIGNVGDVNVADEGEHMMFTK